MNDFNQFVQLVKICIEAAEEKYGVLPPIEIKLDIRGRIAGYAYHKNGKYGVRFNKEAIMKHWDDMVKNTIPHEIAHVIAYAKPNLGARNHNYEWKRIARSLGCTGDRCHSYDLTPAKTKTIRRHKYRIATGEELLIGPKHHELIQLYGYGANVVTRRSRQPIGREHYIETIIVK